MKKLFTFFFSLMISTALFAQADWTSGQDISDQISWQDYSGASNASNAWTATNVSAYSFEEWEMFNVPNGAEFYQIFWLPAGYYQFTVQGFYRGDYRVPYWNQSEKINAVFFGESVNIDEETGEVTEVTRTTSTPLQSIASSENSTGRLFETTEWTNDVSYSYDDVTYYVPNCMEGTRQYFDAGYYKDNVIKVVHTEDGYVKLGIRKTATLDGDWVIFTNFQAFYISDAGEAVQLMVAQEEFQNQMILVDDFRRTLEEAGYVSLLGYYENEMVELEDESGTYTTVGQYNTAIGKLNALILRYRPILSDAKALTDLIASCEDLAGSTDYSGLADFQAAIAKAKLVEADEFGSDTGGVYTSAPEDYTKALNDLKAARAAYMLTKPEGEKGYQDLSGLIAYPFFCQPEYNPVWNEEAKRWEPQDIVLNGDGVLQGWNDLGESGSDNNSTYNTTTRIPIGKGVNIGTDETVLGEWYQVNTNWYEPYWNHKLSSAKQWNMPRSEMEIAQNLTGLPEGYYSIQGCGITWSNDWSGNCNMGIRITSGGVTVQSEEETRLSGWWNYSLDDWTYYTTGMIHVTDGTARVAFFANGFSSFTGMQLHYYGENPDFTKLVENKLSEVDTEALILLGDKAEVEAMMNSITLPIVGYDAYEQALKTIDEAKTYINTANNYVTNNDITAMFANLQGNYSGDSNEYKYLGTAVFHTFDIYEGETSTYKDLQACVDDYNEYVHYIEIVNNYSKIDNADLKAAVNEQAAKLEDEYATAETLKAYEKALAVFYNATIMADLGMENASEDNPVDISVLLVNPSFTENHNGWTGNFTVDNGLQNAEAYNTNFRIEQTVFSLPAGKYKAKVKSYYRDGSINSAFDHVWYMESGEYTPNVKFFANKREKDVVSICNEDALFTERSYTEYSFTAINPAAELGEEEQTLRAWVEEYEDVDEDGNISYTVISWRQAFDTDGNVYETDGEDAWIYDSFFMEGGDRYFYPNSMRGGNARFKNDNGAYDNEVTVVIGEGGDITIGLYKDTTIDGDWCLFDDFQLFYLGKAALRGDVNEDGKVDINDVVAVINVMAGTADWANANVNEDANGNVDINDVVAIINEMAGI